MNIKNNKGITLLALVITVIILAIIAGVSISLGTNMLGTAKFESVETNLMLIQSKTKIIAEKLAIGEIDQSEAYGTKQEDGEYSGWYLLSQADLNTIGVKDAKAEDNYYVNYDNDDVAYGKGITFEGVTFYKLSDILSYTDQ